MNAPLIGNPPSGYTPRSKSVKGNSPRCTKTADRSGKPRPRSARCGGSSEAIARILARPEGFLNQGSRSGLTTSQSGVKGGGVLGQRVDLQGWGGRLSMQIL